MNTEEYIEARRACREEAAQRLGWDEIPDAAWARADDLELIYDVVKHRDKKSWRELLDVLQTERDVLSDRTAAGRGEERAAPKEIDVKLEDHTRHRGQVYGAVAAAAAERRSDVYNFRRSYLREGLLTESEAADFQLPGRFTARLLTTEEADAFLAGRETGRLILDRSTKARERLRWVAGRLAHFYGWRERDAAHFVLTGHEPVYRPVRVAVGFSGENTSDHVPNTARVFITADLWADTEEVANAYRAARRQILGGDRRRRRMDDRALEVVTFVTRQIREHGPDLKWPNLQRRWNEEHPPGDEGHYSDRNGLMRAYKRAYRRLWRPEYNRPKWKRHDTS